MPKVLIQPSDTGRKATFTPRIEILEDRLTPSTLLWTNRGQADDRFDAVFGANAEAARKVVDYCLTSWGKVIVNLNQPAIDGSADRNTISMTVKMTTAAGNGGAAQATKYAYATQEDKDADRNGYPVEGAITLDSGTAGQVDRGWWIDPNPGDFTPFTDIKSPFAANRSASSDGADRADIVDIVNGEIAHVLGLFLPPARIQNPLNGTLTKLNPAVADTHGSKQGFYYVFDGPSITQLLTSYDSGGGDLGNVVHTPQPTDTNLPITFNSKYRGNVTLTGALDAGNALGGTRVIPSDNLMKLFKDAYGYEVLMPSTLPGGTFNASVTPLRRLVVQGGPDGDPEQASFAADQGANNGNGNAGHGQGPAYHDQGGVSPDRITLKRDGTDLVITILPGRAGPVENTDADAAGNGRPIVTRVPLADFDGIDLKGYGGDDAVILDLSGGDFIPDGAGGFNLDGGDGADGVSVIGAPSKINGGILTIPGIGTVNLASVTGPDPELLGTNDTAVSVGGTVYVVESNGGLQQSLTPFPGTPGGARSAIADFNGDGVSDIATATGLGGTGRVIVLDGETHQELFAIEPFGTNFTRGVFVAVGDLNADDVPDLIVSPDRGGGPRLRIFSGTDFTQIADFFGIDDVNFRGGAHAAVGDVNGDGTGDLIVTAGSGGGPRVAGFNGKSIAGTPTRLWADFFAFETTLRGGINVAAGDVTGDGIADVVVGAGSGGAPRVTVFDGAGLLNGIRTRTFDYFAGDATTRGGARVAVKDLDGDGRADVVTASTGRTGRNLGKDLDAGITTGSVFAAFGDDPNGIFVG